MTKIPVLLECGKEVTVKLERRVKGGPFQCIFHFQNKQYTRTTKRYHYPEACAVAKVIVRKVTDAVLFPDLANVSPKVNVVLLAPGEAELRAKTWLAQYAKATENRTPGIVYMLRTGLFYKIGMTTDFHARYWQIQLNLPWEVERIHTIRAGDIAYIEKYWHLRFSDKRTEKGEWFVLTAQDVALFKSYTEM